MVFGRGKERVGGRERTKEEAAMVAEELGRETHRGRKGFRLSVES